MAYLSYKTENNFDYSCVFYILHLCWLLLKNIWYYGNYIIFISPQVILSFLPGIKTVADVFAVYFIERTFLTISSYLSHDVENLQLFMKNISVKYKMLPAPTRGFAPGPHWEHSSQIPIQSRAPALGIKLLYTSRLFDPRNTGYTLSFVAAKTYTHLEF